MHVHDLSAPLSLGYLFVCFFAFLSFLLIYLSIYLSLFNRIKSFHLAKFKYLNTHTHTQESKMQGLQILVNQGGAACSCGVAYPEGADKDTYVCSCGAVSNRLGEWVNGEERAVLICGVFFCL